MEKLFNEFTIACGAVGGLVAGYLGGWDNILQVLIFFLVVDYATGVLKAIKTRNVTSEIGFWGIIKKVYMLIGVAMAYLIQVAIAPDIPLREVVIFFFISNEGISILENAAQFGVPFPKQFTDILLQLRGDKDE